MDKKKEKRRKVFIKDRDMYKGLNKEEKRWLKEFNDLESNCYMVKYLKLNEIYKDMSEEDKIKIEKELKSERESRRKDLLSKRGRVISIDGIEV